jgi:DHA3 family macrolide efflux protein-like MFS transporter
MAGFMISQNVSMFGSSVVGYAIIWHVTLETSSGIWMAVATICMVAPQLVLSLFGGVWADRHNRKYMIMLADGFIAIATLILAILFMIGIQNLALIMAVSTVRSVGAGIQAPAGSALYPQMVPESELTRIQGINQTLMAILQLLGPIAGGAVLGIMGIVGAFFVDVVTASLAIVIFAFIHVDKVKRVDEITTVVGELKQGLAYSFSDLRIKRMIKYYAVAFFLMTPTMVLTPLLIERSFGGDIWRLTVNEMVWGVGSLLGGIFVSVKGSFRDKLFALTVAFGAFGTTFALLGAAPNFIIYCIIMGISGFFLPIMVTASTVYIQEIVPPDRMGRVFSLVNIIGGAAMPIAVIIFGPLADIVSINILLITSGILVVLMAYIFHRGNVNLRKMGLYELTPHPTK